MIIGPIIIRADGGFPKPRLSRWKIGFELDCSRFSHDWPYAVAIGDLEFDTIDLVLHCYFLWAWFRLDSRVIIKSYLREPYSPPVV